MSILASMRPGVPSTIFSQFENIQTKNKWLGKQLFSGMRLWFIWPLAAVFELFQKNQSKFFYEISRM